MQVALSPFADKDLLSLRIVVFGLGNGSVEGLLL